MWTWRLRTGIIEGDRNWVLLLGNFLLPPLHRLAWTKFMEVTQIKTAKLMATMAALLSLVVGRKFGLGWTVIVIRC